MPVDIAALMASTAPSLTSSAPAEGGIRFREIPYAREFYRIIGVPRRQPPKQEDPSNVALAEWLTDRFAKVPNPYPGRLLPIQGMVCKEAWENNGGAGFIGVGKGKTVPAFLLPEVWQAERPLIITKAAMVGDMEVYRQRMAKDWHIRSAARCPIISFEAISAPSGGEDLDDDGNVIRRSLLERLAPTHVIIDEAHCFSNPGATGTKRMAAFLRKNPTVPVWWMTGTPFKTSILDCTHMFGWSHKGRAPLPYDDFRELQTWANHLDARTLQGSSMRAGVGALIEFLLPEERLEYDGTDSPSQQLTLVRRAIARRILETPGVIGTQDPPLDVQLHINHVEPDEEDDEIEELFKIVRGVPEDPTYPGWRLPDGTEIADGIAMARQASNAGFGFWQTWLPRPPDSYLFARNQWSRWCRKAIQTNRMGIDSEARMKDAVSKWLQNDRWTEDECDELIPKRPDLVATSRLACWRAEEAAERERTGLPEPPSVAIWVSEQIVEVVRDWLQGVGSGIIWVNAIGLGELLESRLHIPYYREGGLDARGRDIKRHVGGPAIASVKANGTGKNLQEFWSNALWLTPPGEQSLGRLHRAGQTADTVRNWVFLGCLEHLRSFGSAKDVKANFAEEMTLSPQKLTYAVTDMPSAHELESRGGRRWADTKKETGHE